MLRVVPEQQTLGSGSGTGCKMVKSGQRMLPGQSSICITSTILVGFTRINAKVQKNIISVK